MSSSYSIRGLGARLRRIRTLKDMSQTEVAKRAEITPSYLSQLEKGKTGANVATVMRIAEALEVKFSELFDEEEDKPSLQRKNELAVLHFSEGHVKHLLSPASHPTVELYSSTIHAGCASSDTFYTHGASDEFLYVIRGELTVYVGQDIFRVDAGDILRFNSSVPHRMANESTDPVSVLIVVTPPTEYD